MYTNLSKRFVALTLFLTFVGCGKGPIEDSVPVAVEEVPQTEHDTVREKTAAPKAPPAESEAETEIVEKPVEVVFDPPFPDRVELFRAPKRQGKSLAKTKGEQTDVELLGISNVGKQQALIAVNGIVGTVAEGEKYFDYEVISIQYPKVVLQKRRQRLQMMLEYN